MRSQRFEIRDKDLVDEYAAVVDVFLLVDQGEDQWGNELPPAIEYYLQQEKVDLQPLGGRERAAQSGTQYESTHVFNCKPTRTIPVGAKVTVEQRGTIRHMRVTFVADHGSFLSVELIDG